MRTIVLGLLLSIVTLPAMAGTFLDRGNVVTLHEDNWSHSAPRWATVHSLSARTDKICLWWNDETTFGRAIVLCDGRRFAIDDTPTGADLAE